MTHEHTARRRPGCVPRPGRVACDPEQDDADWPYDDQALGPQGLPLVRDPW